MDKIAYVALANSSCVWGCNKCGMPNYFSSLLNWYSDIEHSNRFSPMKNDNFLGPQFSSTPQRQRTQGQLNVDGSLSSNSNTTPNHVPDFPHSRKHDQIRVCTINFCSLISHDKQLQLHQVIKTYKPDVILGWETHLIEEINSNDIFPNEFLYPPPNHKDRASREKVGVLIAIHSDITSVEQSSPADCAWTKISQRKSDNVLDVILGYSDFPDMPNVTIDIDGVTKLLQRINPSKATGPGLIPMPVLKEAASAITAYLYFIFQQSIDTGFVPADWKHSNIIAVYMKGSRTELHNYRPFFFNICTVQIIRTYYVSTHHDTPGCT